MKERIQSMYDLIKSKAYDNEDAHGRYDELLQDFILNYDLSLLPLMTDLINLEKDFWYA